MKSATMECPVCGGNLTRGEREEICEYKGGKVTYMQPGWWCGSCDEAILKGDDNTVSPS
ncbi:MAG: YgiT-type zinc finger protein [Magnetococcales bacterium]|nr:YgiT-type zinc finger protein [Magnetococcales bacterium]